jgi:hypothetical protein
MNMRCRDAHEGRAGVGAGVQDLHVHARVHGTLNARREVVVARNQHHHAPGGVALVDLLSNEGVDPLQRQV